MRFTLTHLVLGCVVFCGCSDKPAATQDSEPSPEAEDAAWDLELSAPVRPWDPTGPERAQAPVLGFDGAEEAILVWRDEPNGTLRVTTFSGFGRKVDLGRPLASEDASRPAAVAPVDGGWLVATGGAGASITLVGDTIGEPVRLSDTPSIDVAAGPNGNALIVTWEAAFLYEDGEVRDSWPLSGQARVDATPEGWIVAMRDGGLVRVQNFDESGPVGLDQPFDLGAPSWFDIVGTPDPLLVFGLGGVHSVRPFTDEQPQMVDSWDIGGGAATATESGVIVSVGAQSSSGSAMLLELDRRGQLIGSERFEDSGELAVAARGDVVYTVSSAALTHSLRRHAADLTVEEETTVAIGGAMRPLEVVCGSNACLLRDQWSLRVVSLSGQPVSEPEPLDGVLASLLMSADGLRFYVAWTQRDDALRTVGLAREIVVEADASGVQFGSPQAITTASGGKVTALGGAVIAVEDEGTKALRFTPDGMEVLPIPGEAVVEAIVPRADGQTAVFYRAQHDDYIDYFRGGELLAQVTRAPRWNVCHDVGIVAVQDGFVAACDSSRAPSFSFLDLNGDVTSSVEWDKPGGTVRLASDGITAVTLIHEWSTASMFALAGGDLHDLELPSMASSDHFQIGLAPDGGLIVHSEFDLTGYQHHAVVRPFQMRPR